MLASLTLILLCQLGGELLVGALGLPVPGPVLGMALLFVVLALRGKVPAELGQTAGGLLQSLSLLFVPAGTGVMLHFRLLGDALVPLGASLVISTIVAVLVTGLMMRWLAGPPGHE